MLSCNVDKSLSFCFDWKLDMPVRDVLYIDVK